MATSRVLMYATATCPYCSRARQLFASLGIEYTEIDVDSVDGARATMQARSGRTSVPQIFVGERHLGGYDDTRALHDTGELERLLAATVT